MHGGFSGSLVLLAVALDEAGTEAESRSVVKLDRCVKTILQEKRNHLRVQALPLLFELHSNHG